MNEPTLESMADSHAAGYWREFRTIAREIIALRDYTEQQVGVLHDRFETDGHRLESAAAPAGYHATDWGLTVESTREHAPAGCEPDRSVSVPPDDPTLLAALDWREQFLTAHRNFLDMSAQRDEARRERDAFKELTHAALDAVGVETHPPDLHGHRMVDRIYVLGRARDEAYEKLIRSVRESYPLAFSIIVSERDALQQQLDASRAALAKIASYPPFDSSPSCMRKIATDALATAGDTKPSEPAPSCTDMGKHAKHPGCPGRNKTIDDLYHDAQYGGC